jgi:hypothetical protein
LEQAAADFGVYLVALSKWMRRADVHDGTIREPAVADPSFGNCGAATVCSSMGTKFAPGGSVSVASSSSGKRWLYRVIDSLGATGAAVDPILSPPGSRRQNYYKALPVSSGVRASTAWPAIPLG